MSQATLEALYPGMPNAGTARQSSCTDVASLKRRPANSPWKTLRACGPRSSPAMSTSAHAVPSG